MCHAMGQLKGWSPRCQATENMPPFYETLLEIPDLSFPRSSIKPELVPGMQATIDILGGKRTVMDYISPRLKRPAALPSGKNNFSRWQAWPMLGWHHE